MTREPMTQEQLDAIRGRVGAATGAPWAVDSDDPSYIICSERGGWDGLVIAQIADQDGALFPVEHNGALIVNAPQDLTDLLAEVERLRALTTVDDAMTERTYTRKDLARAWENGHSWGWSDAKTKTWAEQGADIGSREGWRLRTRNPHEQGEA